MTDDAALPTEYAETFRAIRDRVTATRSRVQLAANAHLIHLYWSIGSVLLERSKTGRWGSGVLRQLAEDLRVELPSMKGLSPTNLKYMRQFAAAWPEEASIGQQAVDQLPWGHITLLLGVADEEHRGWYVQSAVQGSWSRNVLRHNIRSRVAERHVAAPTNFSRILDTDGDAARAARCDLSGTSSGERWVSRTSGTAASPRGCPAQQPARMRESGPARTRRHGQDHLGSGG